MLNDGSIHGRFQPFHNDHLEYALAARRECKFLWIGITKYDITPIDATPLGLPRERPDYNPLTYFERINIIGEALVEAGVNRDSFSFVPFPIETPKRLPLFMPRSIQCFTTIREDWNRQKIQVLKEMGYEVIVLWERAEKTVTGGLIRDDIVAGGVSWKTIVPLATARAVERLNLRDRLITLRGINAPDQG
jgi:nicotinamide mononucleotide adenylyltransferase